MTQNNIAGRAGDLNGTLGLMTPAELAAELNVTEKTLGNWRYEKKGPAYISTGTARGKVTYLRADVLEWLKVQRVPTAECA